MDGAASGRFYRAGEASVRKGATASGCVCMLRWPKSAVIFLHGGIAPRLAHLKLDTINSHILDEIKAFD